MDQVVDSQSVLFQLMIAPWDKDASDGGDAGAVVLSGIPDIISGCQLPVGGEFMCIEDIEAGRDGAVKSWTWGGRSGISRICGFYFKKMRSILEEKSSSKTVAHITWVGRSDIRPSPDPKGEVPEGMEKDTEIQELESV